INSNPVLLRLREEIEKGLAGKWIRPIQETIRKRKVPFKLSIKFFDWSSVETLFKTKPEVERLPILKTAFRRFFARKGKYSMMEEKQYLFNERKKKWDLVDGKK